MLNIIDINSSAECLDEILELKEGFRTLLTKVNYGTVIIINNFPAQEIIDYLIIIDIEKKGGNYYQIKHKNANFYLDNLVIAVLKFEVNDISSTDKNNLYSHGSSFDYSEANNEFNYELNNFLNNYQNILCTTLFNISTSESINSFTPQLLLNEKLTAEKIIDAFTLQHIEKYPKLSRIRAFLKDVSDKKNTFTAETFIENIIANNNNKFEYGILTKKKLELIANRNNKIVDNIHENIGSAINIITGKAGTGKTVYLIKSIYKLVGNNQRARLLTFNNALVKDIKCTLRGYGTFNLSNLSSSTIHSYFYKLVKTMGINLILSEYRVNELLKICEVRFEKFRPTYDKIENLTHINEHFLLNDAISREKDKSNYPEFKEIAKYFTNVRDFTDWDKIKSNYLEKKRTLLLSFLGSKVFIEDYHKVLETLYKSITDTKKFYEEFNIENRYDLLSFIYKVDKHTDNNTIPYQNVESQVMALKRSATWSVIFIDEAQDCEQYEKEILFALRGSETMVVASGGKEQLIRSSGERIWNRSNGRKIPFNLNKLYSSSYRQKENILEFVNELAKEYTIDLQLQSHSSSKGTGKIIIDLRETNSLYDFNRIDTLLKYGKLNECSIYESLMILVTSKYIKYETEKSFIIDGTDHVKQIDNSINKKLKEEQTFEENGNSIWSGISENKSELQIPFHNQLRVIPYDSCRGLEGWSVMCLDLDGFIEHKRGSDKAKLYLADDLFLTEEERKDKYAITWLLMAFTRPMDTLYLDLRKSDSAISKKIITICQNLKGIEIIE